MIKRALYLLLLSALLIGCSIPSVSKSSDDIPELTTETAETDEESLAVYKDNLIGEYQSVLDEMGSATRYRIDLQIADTLTDLEGHQEVLYTNNETVNLNEIYFRIFPNMSGADMTVWDLRVNGEVASPYFEYENTAVRVDLSDPLQPGEEATISMDFSQTVPTDMGGNYGLYSYIDGILALDQFFPIIPVYDDEGWNVEDPPINADMVYTDEAFFEVKVEAPVDLVLAGSGIEVGSTVNGNRKEINYIGGPLRDFYLAASPDFQSASLQVGETHIVSYFLEEYRDSGMMVLEIARNALDSYNQRFGTYPYTEFDLISTPMNAGGMEYSSAVALSLSYYDPSTNENALIYLESTTAHEIAHQWFFNQVMSDQIDEPWMDEALVQYSTYLYYLDRYGEESVQGYVDSWYRRWIRVAYEEIPIGKPAGDYALDEYSPIVYGRGPLFFAALKEEIGQETFDRLLRTYADKYRWGISDGQAFKSLAEKTCECDLTDLFRAWVYD